LGDDNHFSALALNARFGPGVQLVGAFSRDENKTKLAIDPLWKFHFCSPFAPAPSLPTGRGLNPMTESRGRKTTDEGDCPINCWIHPPLVID
jgi:hypothetical protein